MSSGEIMSFGLYEALSLTAALQLVLLSVFLITQRHGRRLSRLLLAAFLFLKSLGVFNHLLNRLGIQNPHVFFIFIPFAFLWGPSLYLYVRSLTSRDFKLRFQDVFHLVPFFLCTLYFIRIFHINSTQVKLEILAAIGNQVSFGEWIVTIGLHVLIAAYLIMSIRALMSYRRRIKKIYSSLERIDLSWLNIVLFGFISIWMLDVAVFILRLMDKPYVIENGMVFILLFVFSYVIVFKGLKQPEVFGDIEIRSKYRHSPLDKEEKEKYLKRLKDYMIQHKPYLDPSLTIDGLAKKIVVPSRYLSQVINESLGMNFFDFVNRYRIEEAKQIMAEASASKLNILDILFDAGFNTKSVFNRVFKQQTGMTPSEFRRQRCS